MNYKDFQDYPQLIQILKSRKLMITDEDQAIEFLKKVHYYRLSAYFIPFQYPKNSDQKDIFKDNVTFEDIANLYNFDAELRELFFSYVSDFEIILRAQLSHIHTKKYNPFGYMEDPHSLKRELRIKDIFLFYEFISQANKEKQRSHEEFIEHIKKKYKINDLPLWVLVEILSFGAMSKFFKLMQLPEQLEFLEFLEMKDIRVNVFENWLESLAYVRNICAHHGRLWNKNLVKKFKEDIKYPFLNQSVSRDKVFFALSVLAQILKDSSIKRRFKALLQKYPHIPTKSMGIPQSWETLSPWSDL
ncbi:Abi family protein [Helicobacter cholecystus]|uniref:Abi family protein n=1 Tax=Helicobacter cholecystus TaxID=45498 RepID=A0A3D8IWU5_9HELI|nr:Abi family protein [Helicobacter cholecystus]RDU69450.1 Abi family protein [Helicobacter cholecystus]VEJ24000.1 Abortive infection bacteriophage resistance protein [Helicobacter cholecystus]